MPIWVKNGAGWSRLSALWMRNGSGWSKLAALWVRSAGAWVKVAFGATFSGAITKTYAAFPPLYNAWSVAFTVATTASVFVEVSTNGGASWSTQETMTIPSDGSYTAGPYSVDISISPVYRLTPIDSSGVSGASFTL